MCNKKSIKEIKYNTKKKTTSYKEQCKEKVNKYLNEIKNFSEEDIVYIDETEYKVIFIENMQEL